MSIENYDIQIKRTFLSFAQNLFADDPKYTWLPQLNLTKVLIVDKYALNLKVLESKRSIVLSRGAYGWSQRGLGQLYVASQIEKDTKSYLDTIRGSITYNCIAQNGLIAEHMAHKLFSGLAAFKDQFRKNGIRQLSNINIGEETVLKSDSNVELVTVPVHVQFETDKEFRIGEDYYSIYLEDANGLRYYQGTDFSIERDGTIEFYEAVTSGLSLTATYINSITLAETVESLTAPTNGVNTSFTTINPVYGEYPFFSGIETTVSGVTVW